MQGNLTMSIARKADDQWGAKETQSILKFVPYCALWFNQLSPVYATIQSNSRYVSASFVDTIERARGRQRLCYIAE